MLCLQWGYSRYSAEREWRNVFSKKHIHYKLISMETWNWSDSNASTCSVYLKLLAGRNCLSRSCDVSLWPLVLYLTRQSKSRQTQRFPLRRPPKHVCTSTPLTLHLEIRDLIFSSVVCGTVCLRHLLIESGWLMLQHYQLAGIITGGRVNQHHRCHWLKDTRWVNGYWLSALLRARPILHVGFVFSTVLKMNLAFSSQLSRATGRECT